MMYTFRKTLNSEIQLHECELHFLQGGLKDYARLGAIHTANELMRYMFDTIGSVEWEKLIEVMKILVEFILSGGKSLNFERFLYVRDSLGGVVFILMGFYEGIRSGEEMKTVYTKTVHEQCNYSFLYILGVILQDKTQAWYMANMDLIQSNVSKELDMLHNKQLWLGEIDILKFDP